MVHAPVGTFRANGFGLHDVIGNVWEWCRDGYSRYSLEVSEDTGERVRPGARNRVYRGCSFYDTAVYARFAIRTGNTPEFRVNLLGARASRSVSTD